MVDTTTVYTILLPCSVVINPGHPPHWTCIVASVGRVAPVTEPLTCAAVVTRPAAGTTVNHRGGDTVVPLFCCFVVLFFFHTFASRSTLDELISEPTLLWSDTID